VNPFRHLLDELNEVLDRHQRDDETQEREQEHLQQLRADVEDKLAHERPADEDPERHSRLVESLQDAEDRLQAEHPRLSQAIQQALRSLADAGL
jgi:chromosome segregation ATPase